MYSLRFFFSLLIASVLISGCNMPNLGHYAVTDGETVIIQPTERSRLGSHLLDYRWETPTFGELIRVGSELHYTPHSSASAREVITLTADFADNTSERGKLIIHINPQPRDAVTGSATELRMKGSHNSYHVRPAQLIHNSHDYSHPPLYEQLSLHGVRVLELDLHKSPLNDQYEVYHIAAIDQDTRCWRFTECLRELALWSDHHPNHTPVFVWLEIKDFTGGKRIESLGGIEQQILDIIGDRLYTPDDLKASYASIQARLQAEQGWPAVSELQGKFVFIILNPDRYLADYTHGFQHVEHRPLFPRASPEHFAQPWAAITKLSVVSSDLAAAHNHHLLIAANTCTAPIDLARCEQSLAEGIANGVQMIKTDDVTLPFGDF